MTTYIVTLSDGSSFHMSANMVQAAAAISVDFHGEGEWQPTPFQTADARHSETTAAEFAYDYFRAGPEDDAQVVSVEAMGTIEVNGREISVPAGAVAYKYADPMEDARWIDDADEARDIEREDPLLIVWVE